MRAREELDKRITELEGNRTLLYNRLTGERGKQQETVEAGKRERESEQIKTYAEEYNNTQKKGDEAAKTASTLHLAEAFLNDPSFDSGTFSENKLAYKRFMTAIGQGDSNQALTQEGFRKATSEAILEQLKSLGGMGLGQVKNKEFETMQKAAQSTENTPATNRLLTEMGLRLAERWTVPLAQMARDYKRTHGNQLDAGWDEEKARFLERTPMFSDAELRDVRRIAPIYARTPQEAQRKGWHDGEPLRVPPPPGAPAGTPDRIITHLKSTESPGIITRIAPYQQER
jgi:hypothetical protein